MLYYILAAIAGAVIALAIYIAVSRAAAKGRAAAIIEKAELEGENIKQQKILQAIVGTCIESGGWAAGLAFIPINLYNGQRGFIQGKVMKYLFYAAYPLHILIIYLIKKKFVGF